MNDQHPISQEEWEQMEQYLAGQLSPAEHAAFEARMTTNATLRSQVEDARLLITGIRESVLEEKLQRFHEQLPIPIRKKGLKLYWYAAAAAVIGIIATTIVMMQNKKDKGLYAAYFEPDPGLATAMGSSDNYTFNLGMIQYRSGSYQQAINTWRPLLQGRATADTLHYFIGVAMLSNNQTDSARYHLQQTLLDATTHFRSDANWFIGLSLIQQKNVTEARTYIEASTHPRKEELLARLK